MSPPCRVADAAPTRDSPIRARSRDRPLSATGAVVAAATGGAAVASIQPGWGMFGVMLWLGGLGALALALVLFSAAIAIVVALRTRGDRDDDESIITAVNRPLVPEDEAERVVLRVTALGRLFLRNIAMPFDARLRARADDALPIFSRTV